MEKTGTVLLFIVVTLDIYWQAAVRCGDIKEAIMRAQKRMLYFSRILFSSWNLEHVLLFSLFLRRTL